MPAPANAQATEKNRQKQLRAPILPYLKILKPKAPIAHKGANTQKIISWVSLVAPHQKTMFIPQFILVAAMTHPR